MAINKKELSEAIEEGIYKGFWKPIWISVITILGCFIAMYLIMWGIGRYKEYKCSKEGICPQLQVGASELSCFPLKNLECDVIVGNSTFTTRGDTFRICGYQEANALFEQIKPRIIESLKEHYPSWKIKYLECN